jgi:chromosome segregation ATPase
VAKQLLHQQGMAEVVLNATPVERIILEEAAGVKPYQLKKTGLSANPKRRQICGRRIS